jgi:hypothetical protein
VRKTTSKEQRAQKNRKHKKMKHTTKRTSGKHMKAEPEKEKWGKF